VSRFTAMFSLGVLYSYSLYRVFTAARRRFPKRRGRRVKSLKPFGLFLVCMYSSITFSPYNSWVRAYSLRPAIT